LAKKVTKRKSIAAKETLSKSNSKIALKKKKATKFDVKSYVQESRKEYYTNTYPLTMRAISDMYTRDVFELNPDFQRMFRWDDEQKTRFIESILLNIPIPSLFFYQADSGKLQVVDGLQRISTWLQFVGLLKDEKGKLMAPFSLGEMSILKELKGRVWDKQDDQEDIGSVLRLILEDQTITTQVIKNESDENAKFEVFRRINSGGSFLSKQELRNALLILQNKKFLTWMESLSKDKNFEEVCNLSERLIEVRYDLELILKFFILAERKWVNNKTVSSFIDDKTFNYANLEKQGKFSTNEFGRFFSLIFSFLNKSLGDGAFKKYNVTKFTGKFLESAFELVTLTCIYNIDKLEKKSYVEGFSNQIKLAWQDSAFLKQVGSGSNANSRIPNIIKYVESKLV
jgi:hypothetical protein